MAGSVLNSPGALIVRDKQIIEELANGKDRCVLPPHNFLALQRDDEIRLTSLKRRREYAAAYGQNQSFGGDHQDRSRTHRMGEAFRLNRRKSNF